MIVNLKVLITENKSRHCALESHIKFIKEIIRVAE